MTAHLLDVNVVIALIDPLHTHHDRAHDWFGARGGAPWHSCPIVQNGVLRVVSNPRYPNTQPAPTVLASLASLTARGDHAFLPDSVSLLDGGVRADRLLAGAQVTDTYLLHLAVARSVMLATFDRRLVTSAVPGGADALFVIP
ncbi:TA system VapC family ribonuclease toxin [Microbacterium telephonicum]|uniref:Ribonuclease VapC n=1 Tax=Microbacterium telephonicum TaxID=1714841 RepID=A0A498CB27_9MICO|nr:TA system VapC family ribonuclease toxin [Microbacterium telephonicum]RLK52369.1 hypothetical protein C7474_0303 [Microbacterium telephonicum]